MLVIPIIFIVFFGGAFVWALLALYVQGTKLLKILRDKTNGYERLITSTYVLVSFMNAYFMHIILIAAFDSLFNQANDYSQVSLIEVYVIITLLAGTVGSAMISWLILSERTLKLMAVVKEADTDGHKFDLEKKKNNSQNAGDLAWRERARFKERLSRCFVWSG